MSDFESFTQSVASQLLNQQAETMIDVTSSVLSMFSQKGYINYLIQSYRTCTDKAFSSILYTLIKRYFDTKQDINETSTVPLPEFHAQVIDLFNTGPQNYERVSAILMSIIFEQYPNLWPNLIPMLLPYLQISTELTTCILNIIGDTSISLSSSPFCDSGDSLTNFIFHTLFEVVPKMPSNDTTDKLVASCLKAIGSIISFIEDLSPILQVIINIIHSPSFSISLSEANHLFNSNFYLFTSSDNAEEYDVKIIEIFDAVLMRLSPFDEQNSPKPPENDENFSNLLSFMRSASTRSGVNQRLNYFKDQDRCIFLLKNIILPNLDLTNEDIQMINHQPIQFLQSFGKPYFSSDSMSTRFACQAFYNLIFYQEEFEQAISTIIPQIIESKSPVPILSIINNSLFSQQPVFVHDFILSALTSNVPEIQGYALMTLSRLVFPQFLTLHREFLPHAYQLFTSHLNPIDIITLTSLKYIKNLCVSQSFETSFYQENHLDQLCPGLFQMTDENQIPIPLAFKTVLSILVATKDVSLAASASNEASKLISQVTFSGDDSAFQFPKLIHSLFNIVAFSSLLGIPDFSCNLIKEIITNHTDFLPYALELTNSIIEFVMDTSCGENLVQIFDSKSLPSEIVKQYKLNKCKQKEIADNSKILQKQNSRSKACQDVLSEYPIIFETLKGVLDSILSPSIYSNVNSITPLFEVFSKLTKMIPSVFLERFNECLEIIRTLIQENLLGYACSIARSLLHELNGGGQAPQIIEPLLQILQPSLSSSELVNYRQEITDFVIELLRQYGVSAVASIFPQKLINTSISRCKKNAKNMDFVFEAIENLKLPSYSVINIISSYCSTLFLSSNNFLRNRLLFHNFMNPDSFDGGLRYSPLKYGRKKNVLSKIRGASSSSLRMKLMHSENPNNQLTEYEKSITLKLAQKIQHFQSVHPEIFQELISKRFYCTRNLVILQEKTGISFGIPSDIDHKDNLLLYLS